MPNLAKLLKVASIQNKTTRSQVLHCSRPTATLTPIGIKLQATMHQFQASLLTFIEKFNKVYHTTTNSL